MKTMDDNISGEILRWQQKLFGVSVRRQVRLKKLKEFLGGTSGQCCLEVTAGDGMISQGLRRDGGEWTTLVPTPEAKDALGYFIPEEIQVVESECISAPDHTFDTVVIVDALEWMRDDMAFIRECHRVLKTDGRLIVTTARRIPIFFFCGLFRILFGESWKRRGLARGGYTSHSLFDALRNGFDVPDTSSYSTGLVEAPGVFGEVLANKLVRGAYNMPRAIAGAETCYHYVQLVAGGMVIYPIQWFFSVIEKWLLYVLPGHNLIAQTKRRVWRERIIPVLRDGRSIAEAALNTKIGTAAPF